MNFNRLFLKIYQKLDIKIWFKIAFLQTQVITKEVPKTNSCFLTF